MLKHTISNSFKLTSNSDIVYIYSDIRTIFLGLLTHVGLRAWNILKYSNIFCVNVDGQLTFFKCERTRVSLKLILWNQQQHVLLS